MQRLRRHGPSFCKDLDGPSFSAGPGHESRTRRSLGTSLPVRDLLLADPRSNRKGSLRKTQRILSEIRDPIRDIPGEVEVLGCDHGLQAVSVIRDFKFCLPTK